MAGAKSERGSASARPLSPHLQIYAPEINMVMSIVHRMTGAALYFGTLILAWVLIAAATGPDYFNYVTGLLGTWPGQIVLIGYTWALHPSHAGRLPPFHLGYRARVRPQDCRSAVVGLAGAVADGNPADLGYSCGPAPEGRSHDHAHATEEGARTRVGQGRRGSFLDAAPDRRLQRRADAVPDLRRRQPGLCGSCDGQEHAGASAGRAAAVAVRLLGRDPHAPRHAGDHRGLHPR